MSRGRSGSQGRHFKKYKNIEQGQVFAKPVAALLLLEAEATHPASAWGWWKRKAPRPEAEASFVVRWAAPSSGGLAGMAGLSL